VEKVCENGRKGYVLISIEKSPKTLCAVSIDMAIVGADGHQRR